MISLKSHRNWLGALALALGLQAPASLAEGLFISDVCYVSLRAGQSNDSRVVHSGIRTGTTVTLLETSTDSEWQRIRTETGQEGWVRKQFVTSNPTAQMQLDKLRAEQAAAKAPADANAEVPAACASYAAELANLKALSADAVNLNKRYQDLLTQHEMAKSQLDSLQAENLRLKDSTSYAQWVYGGILVAAGALLSLFMQLFIPRRRSEWV